MKRVANEQELADWFDRLRQGDETAVQAIYQGYYSQLSAFVRLRISDVGAVEEIVDDTFMAIFTNPQQFEGRSSFKTWLYGVAKNRCQDWLRKTGRNPVARQDSSDEGLAELPAVDWSTLENIENLQLQRLVEQCLRQLPPPQREALYWVFFHELSVREIAQMAACAQGTVKSRLFHGKAKLALCVTRGLNGGVT